MHASHPARTGARPTSSAVLAVLLLIAAAAVGAVVVSPFGGTHDDVLTAPRPAAAETSEPPTARLSTVRTGQGGLRQRGEATSLADEGAVGDGGVSVFGSGSAAVANLDPALLGALRMAANDAGQDGVEFRVNSGWRSADYQEQLLDDAVAEYGSRKEAAHWVATPQTSAHVSGDAVDLGPSAATSWLSRHGVSYGLCQIYRNEPWHYELRPGAVDHGCPAMYADPTQDPRMEQ
jgi:zinc D-Ala-D-Ala carboxypeptidase